MEIPCNKCLKFPICIGNDISKLTNDCVNLRGFLKSRKGTMKAIRLVTADFGTCKLQQNKNNQPIVSMVCYNH